jgi:hypothetical protein
VTSPATLAPAVCSVWTTVAGVTAQRPDIAALLVGSPAVAGQVQSIPAVGLAGAVADATDILFNLSGRQFPGVCSTTVRPVAAPPTWTLAEWTAYWTAVSGNAWSGSWGICNGGESHDACNTPPQIDLGLYPVVAIDEVRIDGVVIPPDEYRVDNNRLLVRVRPTVNAEPTERYGWPTCQDYGLPDGQPNTFAVDVQFGSSAPSQGISACIALAAELAKARFTSNSRLPSRLTQVSRQGVSFAVLDPMTFLDNGLTGVYECDLFIRSYNPGKSAARPLVWSPDLARNRRPTSGGS